MARDLDAMSSTRLYLLAACVLATSVSAAALLFMIPPFFEAEGGNAQGAAVTGFLAVSFGVAGVLLRHRSRAAGRP